MSTDHAWVIDGIAHDLDMAVFRLEQRPEAPDVQQMLDERHDLRRELERIRDRLKELQERMS